MPRKPKKETRDRQPAKDVERLITHSDPEAVVLYELAVQVKELAPWKWMEETDLIGIENPDAGAIGFISVMGSVGEYEAVALYLGAEGFHGFIDFIEDDAATADRLLELPHIQLAFSEPAFLEKPDRDLIKQSGAKISDSKTYPMFRSYRPGYRPWFVTIKEARFLIHALSQTLNIARRVRDDGQPFCPTGRVEEGGYLMRVSRKAGSQMIWEDQVWRIPKPTSAPIQSNVEPTLLESLKRLPQTALTFEADLLLSPAAIRSRRERPVAVYTFMVADVDSGFIFGAEAMTAQDSLAEMHARVPNSLANALLRAQMVPRTLRVRTSLLHKLFRPLTQTLNIELRQVNSLPSVDEAAEALHEAMRTGRI